MCFSLHGYAPLTCRKERANYSKLNVSIIIRVRARLIDWV